MTNVRTARNAPLTWFGHSGLMAGWTGPDTSDGGPHLGYADYDPYVRCPCGWSHHIVKGEVRSWGLLPTTEARGSR